MRSIGSAASLARDIAERAAQDPLFGWLACATTRDRTVRAVERRQRLATISVEGMDGEMDGQRRAGRGEAASVSPSGMARGAAGHAGQHHALRHFRHGQFAAQRGGGGGEGRHAGRQRVGDAAPLEPAHLLGHGAQDRKVAGMEPRHVLALLHAPRHIPPRSRRATAARYRRCARRAGNRRAAPASTIEPA